MSQRASKIALVVLIVGYVAVLGALVSLRHYSFETQGWDMGIFQQTFWNTVHGETMQNSLEEIPNHLGVHMSPFLFLLVPGFALFQSPYFLLLIQTLALALGAIPLYFLARKVLQSEKWALLFAGAYLLYPPLHAVNLFDFHEVAFFAPLMFAAFYFLETRRFGWAWAFLLLAAATKEDAILAVAAVGLWLCIKKGEPGADASPAGFLTPPRKHGLALMAICILYFVVATKLIMPALGGGLLRLDRYGEFGTTATEVVVTALSAPKLLVTTVVTPQKLVYAFWLLFPLALLPVAGVRELMLAAPGFLENLLTLYVPQFSSKHQYDAILIAALFVAALYGLRTVRAKWPAIEKAAVGVFVITVIISFLARSPLAPRSFPTHLFTNDARTEALRLLIAEVPKRGSVAAHTNLIPHLSNREKIYSLGREPVPTDIVVLDGADFFGFPDMAAFQAYADTYVQSGEYEVRTVDDRYFIFIRKGSPESL